MSGMSSSSEQERLQDEIQQLRSELGDTVEALVHKADIPSRVKERGSELREQATQRGTELLDRAVEGAERARHAAQRTSADRWAMFAGAGVIMIILAVVVRRIRVR